MSTARTAIATARSEAMHSTVAAPAPGWLRAGVGVAAVGWGANQFAPMLLIYGPAMHLSSTTLQGTFAMYAVGLIPGLLLGGPVSDRVGRRPVMAAALLASMLGSALLIAGSAGVGLLFAGRLISGVASGAAFSSGAAWIRELSSAEVRDGANPGPRRVTVAIGAGFAAGPLTAGALAQWAPAHYVVPYLPHLAVALIALALVLSTSETRRDRSVSLLQTLRVGGIGHPRFRRVVLPLAIWVFGPASIALAYLPSLLRDRLGDHVVIVSAVVIMLTPLAGNFAQPLARRAQHPSKPRLIAMALAITIVGLLLAALAASKTQPVVIIAAALLLGAGYGCCQVAGLAEVQRIAKPESLGGLTAVYQAVSYIGFGAPFLLAWVADSIAPSSFLLTLAALVALTLAWIAYAATHQTDRRTA